jgi:hypothetical protein
MAITQPTGSGGVLLCRPITELKAMEQNERLDRVLAHLTTAGVHAQLIKRQASTRCTVMLYASGERLWHPPELTIYADAGWTLAVVTVGERSGSYMVELPTIDADNRPSGKRVEIVAATQPARVAKLVAEHSGVAA